jgi:hypothetical protein
MNFSSNSVVRWNYGMKLIPKVFLLILIKKADLQTFITSAGLLLLFASLVLFILFLLFSLDYLREIATYRMIFISLVVIPS